MPAKIAAVVVCDDVRREFSGKEILIGVYTGDILLPTYPARLFLSFWIEIEGMSAGQHSFEAVISMPSSSPEVRVGGELQIVENGTASIVLGSIPVSLDRDGELVMKLTLDDQPPVEVKRKRVRRAKLVPQASVPQPA